MLHRNTIAVFWNPHKTPEILSEDRTQNLMVCNHLAVNGWRAEFYRGYVSPPSDIFVQCDYESF